MKRAVCAALATAMLFAGSATYAARPQGPSCPLSSLERQLVEEVVTKLFFDAVWVAESTHDLHRGFALTLVGVDSGNLGAVTRIGPCEGAKTFVPTCERDFELPLVRCSRLACEAAGVDTIEVSISGGKPKYTKRTALAYEATAFAGSVVYDPFPAVVWRTVEAAPGTYSITAGLFRRPVVTPSDGASIDLVHAGAVSIKVVGGEIASIELDLAFPMLVDGEPQLVVDVSFDASGAGRGSIRSGSETLATISGDRAVVVDWTASCGA